LSATKEIDELMGSLADTKVNLFLLPFLILLDINYHSYRLYIFSLKLRFTDTNDTPDCVINDCKIIKLQIVICVFHLLFLT